MNRAAGVLLGITVVAASALARPAHAQIGWTVYGSGEFDTENTVLVLGGVDIAPKRAGWSPLVGLQAYWLQFDVAEDDQRNLTSVMPSVGIQHTSSTALVLLRAGYSFEDSDVAVVPGVFAPVGEDGVVAGGQLEYWGTGAVGAQAIASYNFGAETFWGRGRVTFGAFSFGDAGRVRIGPEVAYLDTPSFDAVQVGGVVGLNPGRGVALTFGAGRKIAPLSDRDDLLGNSDATYFRFEIALFP